MLGFIFGIIKLLFILGFYSLVALGFIRIFRRYWKIVLTIYGIGVVCILLQFIF